MPAFEEQHLAHMLGPVRIALATAKLAARLPPGAALPGPFADAGLTVARQARLWGDAAAASWSESLRRLREQPRPKLGDPDPAQVAPQIEAAGKEAVQVLGHAVQLLGVYGAALAAVESPAGRFGEIAADLARAVEQGRALCQYHGDPYVERRIPWGPSCDDDVSTGIVALGVASIFCMSAAGAAALYVDDARALRFERERVIDVYAMAVRAVSAAEELAVACSVGVDAVVEGRLQLPGEGAERAASALMTCLAERVHEFDAWPSNTPQVFRDHLVQWHDACDELRQQLGGD